MQPRVVNMNQRIRREVTIFDNETHHVLPIHRSVRVKPENNFSGLAENKPEEIKKAIQLGCPFYVISHTYSANKAPTYTISLIPFILEDGESLIEHLQKRYSSQDVDVKEMIKLLKLAETLSIENLTTEQIEGC